METILVVDDEPEVLALTTSVLRAEGYTIVATGDPFEALGIARSRPEALDLLLTDVVKPFAVAELSTKVRAILSGQPSVAESHGT